jgi:hypothetical protein
MMLEKRRKRRIAEKEKTENCSEGENGELQRRRKRKIAEKE